MSKNKENKHLPPRKAVISHRQGFIGFTLAETLITLLIIGVVAVLTIPALVQQFSAHTMAKHKEVFEKKFTEGLSQMRVDDQLSTPCTTAEFVEKMQKYFKTSNVCDSDNLTGCFTEKINQQNANGSVETFDVAHFKKASDMNPDYEDSEVYGIGFSDGTNMLISYIPDCKGMNAGEKSDGDEYAALTGCLRFVYDINASKSPNTLGSDIVARQIELASDPYGLGFKIVTIAAATGSACPSADYDGTQDAGFCYLTSEQETTDIISKYGLERKVSFPGDPSAKPYDYWGGAMKYCQDKGLSLPDANQLSLMAEKIYKDAGCSNTGYGPDYGQPRYTKCSNQTAITSHPLYTVLNGTVWSNLQDTSSYNASAYNRSFSKNLSSYSRTARNANFKAVCVK